jgi:hypothetical protein
MAGNVLAFPANPKKKGGVTMTARGKCLNPKCDGKQLQGRGLCASCYGFCRRLVKENKTTWDKLVAAGKAKEATKPQGRPPSIKNIWFLDELTEEASKPSKKGNANG